MAATVAAIHATPARVVFEFTGAGSLALWWLHAVAGSSRTVLEATDRYSPESLADLLGRVPDGAVSAATAAAMARAARRRAVALAGGQAPTVGLSCTATIATDRAKRGDHRCFVAVDDGDAVHVDGVVLEKGSRDREAEERVVSRLVISALARTCGVPPPAVGLQATETVVSVLGDGAPDE